MFLLSLALGQIPKTCKAMQVTVLSGRGWGLFGFLKDSSHRTLCQPQGLFSVTQFPLVPVSPALLGIAALLA